MTFFPSVFKLFFFFNNQMMFGRGDTRKQNSQIQLMKAWGLQKGQTFK